MIGWEQGGTCRWWVLPLVLTLVMCFFVALGYGNIFGWHQEEEIKGTVSGERMGP